MTAYIEGATVYHLLEWWDRRTDAAKAHCGTEGEAVEADPDPEDVCDLCKAHSDQYEDHGVGTNE